MKLFDKLRRSTDEGSGSGFPEGTADPEAREPGGVDVGPASSTSSPSPGPSTAAPAASATASAVTSDPGRYDPAHPCHAPVAGVDLVLFAQVTHRLRVAPAEERGTLLAGQGHTPETWSAVNTVWMARLGQMPYLCATFDEASRPS